jgi:hypothetical protein
VQIPFSSLPTTSVCLDFDVILRTVLTILDIFLQMAFEMYGMLAGNVSALTGEYVKPAYGGEKEVFLRKVVTPIYHTIAKVQLDSTS